MSKVSWKDMFEGFQRNSFRNKLTFMKETCTAYNHDDALQS